MSQLPALGGQRTGASASASVLSMSIQGLFPLGLTILISLLSKGLSRIYSSTTGPEGLHISKSVEIRDWCDSVLEIIPKEMDGGSDISPAESADPSPTPPTLSPRYNLYFYHFILHFKILLSK